MKFRKDFVTNSSSSSYVCEACGNVESGWDICLSDAEMSECENGHVVCNHHFEDDISFETKKNMLLKSIEADIRYAKKKIEEDPDDRYYIDRLKSYEKDLKKVKNCEDGDDNSDEVEDMLYDYDLRDTVPEELCPICSHSIVLDSQLISFACERLGMTQNELKELTREYLIASEKEQ